MNLKTIKTELEGLDIPKQLKLDDCTMITDTKMFVDNHVSVLQNNSGKQRYKPYYDRLLKFYKVVSNKKITD